MNKDYQITRQSQEKKIRNLLLKQQIENNIKLYCRFKKDINIKAKAYNELPLSFRKEIAIKIFEQIATLNNSDLSILNYIRKLLNIYSFVNPAQLTIALRTYYSRQTVNKSIKKLVHLGLLHKVNVRHGTTCLYALSPILYLREVEIYLKHIMPSFGFYNNAMYKNGLETLISTPSYYSTTPNIIPKQFTHIKKLCFLKSSSISSSKNNTFSSTKKDHNPQILENYIKVTENLKPSVCPKNKIQKRDESKIDFLLRDLVLKLNNDVILYEEDRKKQYIPITSLNLDIIKNKIDSFKKQALGYKLIFVSSVKIENQQLYKEILIDEEVKVYLYV